VLAVLCSWGVHLKLCRQVLWVLHEPLLCSTHARTAMAAAFSSVVGAPDVEDICHAM
jgi:hypothetical protein